MISCENNNHTLTLESRGLACLLPAWPAEFVYQQQSVGGGGMALGGRKGGIVTVSLLARRGTCKREIL